MISIYSFLILSFAHADIGQSSPEQSALDFFLEELYAIEYKDMVFQLRFETEKRHTRFSYRNVCFEKEYQLKVDLENAAEKQDDLEQKVTHLSNNSEFKFKKRRKNFILIYSSTELQDKNYVEILVDINKEIVHGYFFEIDNSNQILRWCQVREIR